MSCTYVLPECHVVGGKGRAVGSGNSISSISNVTERGTLPAFFFFLLFCSRALSGEHGAGPVRREVVRDIFASYVAINSSDTVCVRAHG